jgi:GGDEF domain-containing protein
MPSDRTLAFYGPDRARSQRRVADFCRTRELRLLDVGTVAGVRLLMNRTFPACLVLDAAAGSEAVLTLVRDLKADAFTAIVPIVIVVPPDERDLGSEALAAGADEVLEDGIPEREWSLRMALVLRRAARDVSVHPTTRLPGTVQIERDMLDRIGSGTPFAVCYADLDHFKEFNDRYGYNSGDRVILLLSKILRDVVRVLAPGGFVGHIGGDDFIINVGLEHLEATCDEIVELFDELIPYQYTDEDRRAGYFLGKDRRGNVHRVPLMTLSIGVVSNEMHPFTHTGQVSELAAEMKSYAKSLPGSKYVVDRRHGTENPSRRDPRAARMLATSRG